MIGVRLNPGLHVIVLDFEAPGFSLGLKISIVSLAIFLAFLIVALLARFSRPPIVKLPVRMADPRRDDESTLAEAPPTAEPIPPRPDADMDILELARSWDEPELDLYTEDDADEDLDLDLHGFDREAEEEASFAPQPGASGQDGPVLLATTGMFDPSDYPPEMDQPSSFDALAYLEQLDRLLEQSEPIAPSKNPEQETKNNS